MSLFLKDFVKPESHKNIRTYQYKGTDASLFYNNFTEPLAAWMV